jgi:hypothetical protein
LLLDLTRNWLPNLGPDASAAGVRVPVRLSLPAFLPGPADELSADAAQRRLDDWIARHLVTVHGQRPAVARHLVAKGWVLPILDGLDEMVSALMKLPLAGHRSVSGPPTWYHGRSSSTKARPRTVSSPLRSINSRAAAMSRVGSLRTPPPPEHRHGQPQRSHWQREHIGDLRARVPPDISHAVTAVNASARPIPATAAARRVHTRSTTPTIQSQCFSPL